MESTLAIFLIFLLPAFVILVPFETKRIGAISATNGRPIKFAKRLGIACVGVASALAVGVVVSGIVMFGPSYITHDFVGLPWFTFIPAILLGIWSASKTSKFVSQAMVGHAASNTPKGQ